MLAVRPSAVAPSATAGRRGPAGALPACRLVCAAPHKPLSLPCLLDARREGAGAVRPQASGSAAAAAAISMATLPQVQAQPQPLQWAQGMLASSPAVLLAAAVIQLAASCVSRARDGLAAALPRPSGVSAQDAAKQVLNIRKSVRVLALAAPLIKALAAESLTTVYARTFEKAAFGFAKMYLFCLFMRVLLSWFPGIDWNVQPWAFLRLITEPYLQIYRGILPPLFGQLDFTPLFGFLILQDVVELMSPVYTLGHGRDTSMFWTTTDIMCYFDGH